MYGGGRGGGRRTYHVIPQRYQQQKRAANQFNDSQSDIFGTSFQHIPSSDIDGNRSQRRPVRSRSKANQQRENSVSVSSAKESLLKLIGSWNPLELVESSKGEGQGLLSDKDAKKYEHRKVEFATFDEYEDYFMPLILSELRASAVAELERALVNGIQTSRTTKSSHKNSTESDSGPCAQKMLVKRLVKMRNRGVWSGFVTLEMMDAKAPMSLSTGDLVTVWNADIMDDYNVDPKSEKNSTVPAVQKNISPDVLLHACIGYVENVHTVNREARIRLGKSSIDADEEKRAKVASKEGGDGSEGDTEGDLFDSTVADVPEGEEGEVAEIDALEEDTLAHQRKKRKLAGMTEEGEEKEWYVVNLGNSVTYLREFHALLVMRDSALLFWLLKPSSAYLNRPPTVSPSVPFADARLGLVETIMRHNGLNPSQQEAVRESVSMKLGFSIIQGPPGSGKTKTLVALLNSLHLIHYQTYYDSCIESLKSSSARLSRAVTRPRLLICAPSNAAVDEVLSRINQYGFIDGFRKRYNPSICRIGFGDRLSHRAKLLTAEGQAEDFYNYVTKKNEHVSNRQRILEEFSKNWSFEYMRTLDKLKALDHTPSNYSEILAIHERIIRLEREITRYKVVYETPGSREDILKEIAKTFVDDAQVVFATLSGAAQMLTTKSPSPSLPQGLQAFGAYGELGGSSSNTKNQPGGSSSVFDCVIIDEAAQATEPASLIPLSLGAKRCILVGDPQQLPATVLGSGKVAVAYGLSLLERVCLAGLSPVMLNMQYRMHPAISSFPRRHFYQGKLQDAESVQGEAREKPYHSHFRPYAFLDVSDGSEVRLKNKSVLNPREARLTVQIYSTLKNLFGSSEICSLKPDPRIKSQNSKEKSALVESNNQDTLGVGILAPYRSQLNIVRNAFREKYKENLDRMRVEIDTVDSFQGREKEFVIFSCVRSSKSGIGFVRDVRRMNVGITRACSCLLIIGNAEVLSRSSVDWKALITDTRERGLLLKTDTLPQNLNMYFNEKCAQNRLITNTGSHSHENSVQDPRMKRIVDERNNYVDAEKQTTGKVVMTGVDPRSVRGSRKSKKQSTAMKQEVEHKQEHALPAGSSSENNENTRCSSILEALDKSVDAHSTDSIKTFLMILKHRGYSRYEIMKVVDQHKNSELVDKILRIIETIPFEQTN